MTRSTQDPYDQRDSLWARWRYWLQAQWQDYRWFFIGGLWAIALLLGYVGFSRHFAAIGEPHSPLSTLYITLQLFVFSSGSVADPINWPLEVARWLAPAVAAYTALQTLILIFRDQVQSVRLRFFRDHTIICGLGRKGLLLAQGFRRRGEQVVAIERDEDNDLIQAARAEGVVVLTGNAARPELLRRARIHLAKRLIAVSGDDGANVEIGIRSARLALDRRQTRLECFLHVTNPQLCDLLREREIESGRVDGLRLELFNVFAAGARALLNQHPSFDESSTRPLHILVVGLGRLGENLVVQMAKRWSARHTPPGEPLRLTIIDQEAERKVESLCLRYPRLSQVCEITWHAIDVRGPAFQRADFVFDAHGRCDVTTIYICLDNDSLGLASALILRQRLLGQEIPIFVRMEQNIGLARLIDGMHPGNGGLGNLHAFGLLDHTCNPDQLLGGTHEIIARAVHQGYLGLQSEPGAAAVPWDELPEEYRESCRRQADHIGAKLEAIGCALAPLTDWNAEPLQFAAGEVDVMARMEHERWMAERIRDGWTRGARDEAKKTNPYLVPWEELPEDAKETNRNIVRALPACLAEVGLQVYRPARRGPP